MALVGPYYTIIVESFYPWSTAGRHGPVHVRPALYQEFPQNLYVQCSRSLVDTELHPVGTKFRIKVKLTDREGGGKYLYNSWQWNYEIVTEKEFAKLYPRRRKRAT